PRRDQAERGTGADLERREGADVPRLDPASRDIVEDARRPGSVSTPEQGPSPRSPAARANAGRLRTTRARSRAGSRVEWFFKPRNRAPGCHGFGFANPWHPTLTPRSQLA